VDAINLCGREAAEKRDMTACAGNRTLVYRSATSRYKKPTTEGI
jgi:hypothetical protein